MKGADGRRAQIKAYIYLQVIGDNMKKFNRKERQMEALKTMPTVCQIEIIC